MLHVCVQHEAKYVQHDATYVQHEATYVQHEATYVQHEATYIKHKAQEVVLHTFFLVYRLFIQHKYFMLVVHNAVLAGNVLCIWVN